jgi:hypothetical protein
MTVAQARYAGHSRREQPLLFRSLRTSRETLPASCRQCCAIVPGAAGWAPPMAQAAAPLQPLNAAKRPRYGCAAWVLLCTATLCTLLEVVPSLRNEALLIATGRGKQLREFTAGKPTPARGDRARGGSGDSQSARPDTLRDSDTTTLAGNGSPAFMQHAAVVAELVRGDKHIISGEPPSTPAMWLAVRFRCPYCLPYRRSGGPWRSISARPVRRATYPTRSVACAARPNRSRLLHPGRLGLRVQRGLQVLREQPRPSCVAAQARRLSCGI